MKTKNGSFNGMGMGPVMLAVLIGSLALGSVVGAQNGPREMPGRGGPTGDRSGALGAGPRANPPGPGPIMRELGEEFKRRNPEEYERLMTLREEDPQAFREAMRDRMQERFGDRLEARIDPMEKKIGELTTQYHAADGAEKEALKQELVKTVHQAFDARLAVQQEMIERMERRLNELRERVDERRKLRDQICEKRVEELVQDPRLSW